MTNQPNGVPSNYKGFFIKIALGVFAAVLIFCCWYFVTQVNFGKNTQTQVDNAQVNLSDTAVLPDSLSTTSPQNNATVTNVETTNSLKVGTSSVVPNSLATSSDQEVVAVPPLESEISSSLDVMPDSIATSS